MEASQVGGSITVRITGWPDADGIATATLASATLGRVTGVRLAPDGTVCAAGTLFGGHVQVWDGTDAPDLTEAFSAYLGEDAAARISRLCLEGGIDATIPIPSIPTPMGAQGAGKLLDLLREAEQADGGVLHDGGVRGQLVFIPRSARYNAATDMTLDVATGELSPGFGVDFDDSRTCNDFYATRKGGSTANIWDDAHINANGLYSDSDTVSVESDDVLPFRAAWRVHLGTQSAVRYGTIAINLRRDPELLAQWLACGVWGRVRVINQPDLSPSTPIDVFVDQYVLSANGDTLTVQMDCSPATPWDVQVVGSTSRVAPTTTVLRYAIDAVENATLFADELAGTRCTTDPADFPFDIDVDGERMTVTSVDVPIDPLEPTTYYVVRGVNGVAKPHAASAEVKPWSPPAIAL